MEIPNKHAGGPILAPAELALTGAEVRDELQRVLLSAAFAKSQRLQRFLRFTVEETLEGRAFALKEYTISREVYDRGPAFDPNIDSIVRVEAQRLRGKLRRYYETLGKENAVRIQFREGSYVPDLTRRATRTNGPRIDPGQQGATLDRRVVAVMPFANLSPGSLAAHVVEGAEEAITQELTDIREIRVLGRSMILQAGTRQSASQHARALGAGTQIEGSVREAGPFLQATATIIDNGTGHILWGTSLERPAADLFQMHDDLASAAAAALQAQFGLATRPHAAPLVTPSLHAYTTYLKARHAWSLMTPEKLHAALEGFEQVIRLEPGYAPPYAGMADVHYWFMYMFIDRPSDAVPKAKNAALQALRLDPSMAEAQVTLAALLFLHDRDWNAAERMFRQTTEAKPNYSMAWSLYGVLLLAVGRIDQGLAAFQRAQETDPLSPRTKRGFGLALYLSRRYAEAEVWLKAAVEMAPGMPGARDVLIRLRLASADHAAALECAREVRLDQTVPMEAGAVAAAYARNGAAAEALRLIENLRRTGKYLDPMALATAYAGLGDSEKTLEALEAGVSEHSPFAAWFHLEPIFDPYRMDPRFGALVARLNLPDNGACFC